NLAAAIEHGDVIGNVHHHGHVVLDQDYGRAPLLVDLEDVAGHVLFLLLVHAAHGLVEEQNLGVEGEGAAELDTLSEAVCQAARRLLAEIPELEKLGPLFDPRAVRHLFLLCETPIDKGSQHPGLHPHVAAQHYVVEHRHAAEERDVLERTRDAECRDLRWSGAGYVVTLKDDRARVRPIEPADHV